MRALPRHSTPERRGADARNAIFARRFGDALRAADSEAAEAVVQQALVEGLPAATIHSRVITPAMYRIGDLWQASAITVADEHLATAICERVLTSLYDSHARPGFAPQAKILLAAVQGQHHVIGLRMAADVLEGAGHEVLALGSDVPTDSLLAAVERHSPDLVGLSLTMPLGSGTLDDVLHRLQSLRPDLTVLLGGQGVPQRFKDAGWPYVEHADELLAAVSQLLSAPPAMPPAPAPRNVGLVESMGALSSRGVGTAEDRLSKLVSEAGDVARQQARRARALYDAAYCDPLTAISNRRALDERLESGVKAGEFLLMLDLDGFKAVNDTYGHAEGDLVLCQVGDLMRGALRLGDFAARFGGDEFAVILASCDAGAAAQIAERLRQAAETTLADHGVTISIGGAPGGVDDVRGRADRALYRAKQTGRNRVVIDT